MPLNEVAMSEVCAEVSKELVTATGNWPDFNSAHEGFAVLAEEVDELWEHVKTNQKRRDIMAMRKEAIQVAAMAIRFAIDVCNESNGRK
jgi:NTP pyrophosphatase (non-canonical NTP hydrolase)